jgi:hypothetical protein
MTDVIFLTRKSDFGLGGEKDGKGDGEGGGEGEEGGGDVAGAERSLAQVAVLEPCTRRDPLRPLREEESPAAAA